MSNGEPAHHKKVAILAVISDERDRDVLRAIFRHSNWILSFAGSIGETKRLLEESVVPLILCNRDLPGGSWKDLLGVVSAFHHPPRVVVTARPAGENLWAEALSLGCHDVLSQPFERNELFCVLSQAWRNWHAENEIGGANSPRALATVAAT